MITEKTLTKFDFINDENCLRLKEFFKNNLKLKEIHIDIYPTNPLVSSPMPYMLLSRTIEKKMLVENIGGRLVFKKSIDGCDTYFMNVLLSEIKECYYKHFDGFSEFILNIHNIYYKITVFN